MAQQTAVEWLAERLIRMIPTISPMYKYDIKEYVEQAKAMEKEQHGNTWNEAIDAHEKRGHVIARSLVDFDDYYNETYNK
jgi:hypothetical protein